MAGQIDAGSVWPVDIIVQQLGEFGDHQQPGHGGGQAGIQQDIAVADVAELMGDDRLQLIAIQRFQCSARHHNDRIVEPHPGGKAVDPRLLILHIDGWHRHTRGDGHLLDHIAQLLLLEVGGSGQQTASAQRLGHSPAPLAQGLVAAKGDEQTNQHDEGRRHPKGAAVEQLWIRTAAQADGQEDQAQPQAGDQSQS